MSTATAPAPSNALRAFLSSLACPQTSQPLQMDTNCRLRPVQSPTHPGYEYDSRGFYSFLPNLKPAKYSDPLTIGIYAVQAYGAELIDRSTIAGMFVGSGHAESLYRTVGHICCERLLQHQREQPDADARVVVLGCGLGRIIRDMALAFPSANFLGLDLSSEMLALAARFLISSDPHTIDVSSRGFGELTAKGAGLKNVLLLQADAANPPFQHPLDPGFDLVVLDMLVDRVPTEAYINKVLRCALDIVRPHGTVLLTASFCWSSAQAWAAFGKPRHALLARVAELGGKLLFAFDNLVYRECLDAYDVTLDSRVCVAAFTRD